MLARCCGRSPLKSCRFSWRWSGLARAIGKMGHNLHDYDVRCGSDCDERAPSHHVRSGVDSGSVPVRANVCAPVIT